MDQLGGDTKSFGEIARVLSRSPLGIIGLFVVLVYGLSIVAFTSLTSGERASMIYFIMAFPILVFIIFTWLVRTRPANLFAPADYINQDMYERLVTSSSRRAEDPKILGEIKLPAAASNVDPKVPKDWFVSGSNPDDYDLGVDENVVFHLKRSAYIKSKTSAPKGFATLMQVIKATTYKGSRLAMTGYAKSDEVTGWAGFWMRVDGANNQALRFDNMQDRPISGSTGWTKYQVVLDVPEDGENIAFGALLRGSGWVWLDNIEFRSVGKDVPTTGQDTLVEKYAVTPGNLSFEEIESEGD
jgi:hypothetical protein